MDGKTLEEKDDVSLGDVEDISTKLDEDGNVIEDDDLNSSDSEDALRKSIEDSYATSSDEVGKKKEKDDDVPLTLSDEKFFDGDEEALDSLVRDPKAFNTLLNSIYKKAIEKGHNLAVESIMKSAPGIIKAQVSQQVTIQNTVKKFYDDNKDLVPYKQTVAALAAKIARENPSATLDKIFEATEKIARKRLALVKEANDKTDKGARFPKKPTGSRGGKEEKLTGVDKEIEDMLKAL